MTTLTVSRWTKYGKDRLYVNADGGSGWAGWTWTADRPPWSDLTRRVPALADYYGPDEAPVSPAQPAETRARPSEPSAAALVLSGVQRQPAAEPRHARPRGATGRSITGYLRCMLS